MTYCHWRQALSGLFIWSLTWRLKALVGLTEWHILLALSTDIRLWHDSISSILLRLCQYLNSELFSWFAFSLFSKWFVGFFDSRIIYITTCVNYWVVLIWFVLAFFLLSFSWWTRIWSLSVLSIRIDSSYINQFEVDLFT